MVNLPILNGSEVRMILKVKEGSILDVDLLGLYLINKYASYRNDEPFLSVHIPERVDEEDGHILPAINYDIIIRDSKESPRG